ncbi:MAG: hypothetical protein IJ678_00230 [Kiritimatiellae bacterium]|nr:hypothetical protein [Kiritimatiellia bacterium]
MKRLLSLLCLFAATAAVAEISVYELGAAQAADTSAMSAPVSVAEAGAVVAFAGQSPYGSNVGAPSLYLVREAWTNAAVVTPHAWTNFTYSVSYTNTVWSGTNATVTVVTNTAVRPYASFPDTMTGYWTNATVRTWATTNWIPALCSATTNHVVYLDDYENYDGNSLSQTNGIRFFVAPGDKLLYRFSSDSVPSGFRATVWIEH